MAPCPRRRTPPFAGGEAAGGWPQAVMGSISCSNALDLPPFSSVSRSGSSQLSSLQRSALPPWGFPRTIQVGYRRISERGFFMPGPQITPDNYQLSGPHHLHVSYSTNGIDGKPHFTYQDAT